MNKEETAKQKTILNVGYCETTSEWLNRIITELADESKNFVDLSVICAWVLRKYFILNYFQVSKNFMRNLKDIFVMWNLIKKT